MAEDRSDIFFDFNEKFEIHDDNDILKKMGMQKYTIEEAKRLVPNQLVRYLPGYVEPVKLEGGGTSSSSSTTTTTTTEVKL